MERTIYIFLLAYLLYICHGCEIPEVFRGEWFSRSPGDFNSYAIGRTAVENLGECEDMKKTSERDVTVLLKTGHDDCYYCAHLVARVGEVLEKTNTTCVKARGSIIPTLNEVCEGLRNADTLLLAKDRRILPRCVIDLEFRDRWTNVKHFNAEITIRTQHIVKQWRAESGQEHELVYTCHEKRDSRFVFTRLGHHNSHNEYVCFDFVQPHFNVLHYSIGKIVTDDTFSTVCPSALPPIATAKNYDVLIGSKDNIPVQCPIRGQFDFEQSGEHIFTKKLQDSAEECSNSVSRLSMCDSDQKHIKIYPEFCEGVGLFQEDQYANPDYDLKCVAYWKQGSKSYLITYNEEDASNKYRCWVYQRVDDNHYLMSQSIGPFCEPKQDARSFGESEGAQVALSLEHSTSRHSGDCEVEFDDGVHRPY